MEEQGGVGEKGIRGVLATPFSFTVSICLDVQLQLNSAGLLLQWCELV